MTNNFAKLALITTSAILLAGCTKNNTSSTQSQSKVDTEATQFAQAIKSGNPTYCVITKGADKTEYFIKGKKMYTNMATIIENKTVVSHMINDEKYLYMWTDGTKQGSKISLLVSPTTSSPAPTTQAPKFDSESDYEKIKSEGYMIDCKPSNIDETAFIPPKDIKFIDPSDMIKQLNSSGANGGIDMSKLEELKKQYGGGE